MAEVEPTSLPVSVLDPADLQAIMPSLTPEEAELYCQLATLVLEAAFWPNTVPAPPLPPPIQAGGLAIAVRLAAAGEAGGGGQIVSESIGSYTYRLANPTALDQALAGLTEAEATLLRPWLGRDVVFDVFVGGEIVLPYDWWQRDLDRIPIEEPAP